MSLYESIREYIESQSPDVWRNESLKEMYYSDSLPKYHPKRIIMNLLGADALREKVDKYVDITGSSIEYAIERVGNGNPVCSRNFKDKILARVWGGN